MATRSQEVGAIILAAGAGERMGGPKALLLVDGEPLALFHARRLGEAGCAPLLLVTRPELAVRLVGAWQVVASSAPDPAGSLAVGLRALAPAPDDVLVVAPVDSWPARAETLARLVATVREGADAATPAHAGRGGHPVVLRAHVLSSFFDAPRPLRDVLSELGSRRVRVEVDDPAIAIDLDSPSDVLRATGLPLRFAT